MHYSAVAVVAVAAAAGMARPECVYYSANKNKELKVELILHGQASVQRRFRFLYYLQSHCSVPVAAAVVLVSVGP